jgi:hypothetical protein
MSDANVVPAVTEKTKTALGQSAPWLMFLAVMGYIGCGILALLGLVLALVGGLVSELGGMGDLRGLGRVIWPLFGILYIGLAALAFFPALLLHRLSRNAKAYGQGAAANDLEGVAVNLRSLVRYWGIATIVILGVYLLAVLGLMVVLMAMPHYF